MQSSAKFVDSPTKSFGLVDGVRLDVADLSFTDKHRSPTVSNEASETEFKHGQHMALKSCCFKHTVSFRQGRQRPIHY